MSQDVHPSDHSTTSDVLQPRLAHAWSRRESAVHCTEPCTWLHTSTTHQSRVRGLSGVVLMAQGNENKWAAQHCPPSVCTFCVQPRIPWRRLCVPRCVTPAGSGRHRHTDGSKTGKQLVQEGSTISAGTRQYRGPGPNMALAAKLHRDWLQPVGGQLVAMLPRVT